ncbi:MAG: GerMN domain-containing protein [Clostridiales bacterium]|nr:GerMN domain-containing protein [Clostridiales bacterium]
MADKRTALAALLAVACVILCSCASSGLPVAEDVPSVTLPPASVSFVAPIGDAALEYTAPAYFYLPAHDGLQLIAVNAEAAFSPTRPDAESLVRALLAYAGDGTASAVGGEVRLSLYGANPVEVSRDVVTVNLAANALQLGREALYLACQSITNTLTSLPQINYVNFLVADKPVGLDIANLLPMGAFTRTASQDIPSVYNQLLARRSDSADGGEQKPLSANVTLYFPLTRTDGMISEVHTLTFSDQSFSNMIVTILRELALGPRGEIVSPALPLLADLLTAQPVIVSSDEAGGSVIQLEFAYNLDDMLDAYGVTRAQAMASLCYTLCTFFPNVSGISVAINDTPIDAQTLQEDMEVSIAYHENVFLRSDFSAMLYDYCTLFLADAEQEKLRQVQRPIHYARCNDPRTLLTQLSLGPQPGDTVDSLAAVMPDGTLPDTTVLGIALADDTLLVNFSPAFEQVGEGMGEQEERMLAYSIVNTLSAATPATSVCFFLSGSQFDGFSGKIYWPGLFYPLPVEAEN